MVQKIDFRDRDYKGCLAAISDFALTDHTVKDLITNPTNDTRVDHALVKLTATSPASWSSGKYYLKIKFSFYKDDGIAGFNTLVSEVSYPVTFYKSTETSTEKTGSLIIPLKNLDKNYKIRVQVVGGQSGYTFTNIDGVLFLYSRTDLI